MSLLYRLYCLAFCQSYLLALRRADEWYRDRYEFVCPTGDHDWFEQDDHAVKCVICGVVEPKGFQMPQRTTPAKPPDVTTVVFDPKEVS